jgi:two-component sensor histidine kinase
MKLHHFPFLISLLLITSVSAQKKNQKKIDSIATSYSIKARNFIDIESDSALYYANEGLKYAKINNSKKGIIVNLEAKALFLEKVKNNYKESVNIYIEAITLAEVHYKDFLPMLYNGISNLYNRIKDFDRALVYAKKAVEKSKKDSRMRSGTTLNLAIMLNRLGKYEEANKTFKSVLKNNKLGSWGLVIIKSGLASNLSDQNKYKEAIVYYKEAIATDSLQGNKRFRRFYAGIIDNSIEIDDKETVEKYLSLYVKSNQEAKSKNDKKYYYVTYANALYFLGDYKNSIIYKDSLIDINEELFQKKYDKGIVDSDIKYQTSKKDAQIKTEKKKQQFWLLISGLFLGMLLIVVFSLYKNSQKRKQLIASKKSLEIALNQRNMLLRETHHRIKNNFQMVSSLLKLQARGSKASDAVAALENAVQRVNSMIILHQQLYAKDNILGINLQTYIKDLITEITSSYQTENITINQKILSITVNIDTATSIGLLINELATNSIKHAWKKDFENKTITIQIEKANEFLHFEMFDNGIHLKDNPVKKGYGSELISILVKRLKASKLKVQENSFSIHLEIPLQTNEA